MLTSADSKNWNCLTSIKKFIKLWVVGYNHNDRIIAQMRTNLQEVR